MRPDLGALPPAALRALTAALGTGLTGARPVGAGLTGAVTVRVTLHDGRTAFVKACPDGHPQSEALRVEGWFGRRAPAALPGPELLASVHVAGWRVLAFAYVAGRPASAADIGTCTGLARRIASLPLPAALRRQLPPAAVALASLTGGWARTAADPPPGLAPWARAHLGLLVDLERDWATPAAGDHLVHTDLHPENILVIEPGEDGAGAGGTGGTDGARTTGAAATDGARTTGAAMHGARATGAVAPHGARATGAASADGARTTGAAATDGARTTGATPTPPSTVPIPGSTPYLPRGTRDGARAVAVDWTRPALGAPWIDEVLLHARLGLVPRVADAPPGAVAALVAGAAGHWTDGARLPAPWYAPRLPGYRARSARNALAVLRACLDEDHPA